MRCRPGELEMVDRALMLFLAALMAAALDGGRVNRVEARVEAPAAGAMAPWVEPQDQERTVWVVEAAVLDSQPVSEAAV